MDDSLEKRVFIVCPVRGLTDEEDRFLKEYVTSLESKGCRVHYPPRDTNQNDPIGLAIIAENRAAMRAAHEIHIYWNPASEGSKFDLGMLFMAEKPLILINRDTVQRTPAKSFQNVILELDAQYRRRSGQGL